MYKAYFRGTYRKSVFGQGERAEKKPRVYSEWCATRTPAKESPGSA